jgi:hypothetical protein
MLVMTMLVRNEEDILRANLDFHLAMGVDHVIATDNCSEDGTIDILRDYERQGVLTLFFEDEDTYDQAVWVTRMARLAASKWGARWVINNDADEFWWPFEGNLKSALSAIPDEAQTVLATRTNFVAIEPAGEVFHQYMVYREVHSVNGIGRPLPPKVCHRGSVDVVVATGSHTVRWENSDADPVVAKEHPVEILHFPLRSYSQFDAKIRLGGAAVERNSTLPKRASGVWRQLYKTYLAGGLPAYYKSQTVSPDEAADRVAKGVLIRDTRLADWFTLQHAERSHQ